MSERMLVMTVVTKPIGESTARREDKNLDKREIRKLRILAAIGGSERTDTIIKCLRALHEAHTPFEVVLLNVQPKPGDWRLRGYSWFKSDAIHDRLIEDLGRPIVTNAGRQFDRIGIIHRPRIELGEVAETIVKCAREEKCDLIVLADPAPGVIRRWLMQTIGLSICSVTHLVSGFSEVPVVIAK
jgi:nucleotide-binding universal stress UspA family protein